MQRPALPRLRRGPSIDGPTQSVEHAAEQRLPHIDHRTASDASHARTDRETRSRIGQRHEQRAVTAQAHDLGFDGAAPARAPCAPRALARLDLAHIPQRGDHPAGLEEQPHDVGEPPFANGAPGGRRDVREPLDAVIARVRPRRIFGDAPQRAGARRPRGGGT